MPEPLDRRLDAFLDDGDARPLVQLLRIHQFGQRKQAHHHLLRQRQSGRVVQRHVATVGDDAVDEAQLARLEHQRAVALVELLQHRFGVTRDQLIEQVVFMQRDHAESPAGAAKVLAVRIHADGIVRERAQQRPEAGHEGAVDIVRQQDQVGALLQDGADLCDARLVQRHRRRIARIAAERTP